MEKKTKNIIVLILILGAILFIGNQLGLFAFYNIILPENCTISNFKTLYPILDNNQNADEISFNCDNVQAKYSEEAWRYGSGYDSSYTCDGSWSGGPYKNMGSVNGINQIKYNSYSSSGPFTIYVSQDTIGICGPNAEKGIIYAVFVPKSSQSCNTAADLDCDNKVSTTELQSLAQKWVSGTAPYSDLLKAAQVWLTS